MNIVKKISTAGIALVLTIGSAVLAAPASDNDNWRVVKNAVKRDARRASTRGEAKWFKILIADRGGDGGELKITLPLSLVEGLARLAALEEDKHFRCGDRDLDIDILEVLEQLKEAGPMALIEIKDDDGLIRIWIE
ncbi:MAG: hypothetical protein JW843_03560 [Candidatus Aminicenantes bacterium]|nr:hypothetical protein [Candidatus Aminicenantes bacterium]